MDILDFRCKRVKLLVQPAGCLSSTYDIAVGQEFYCDDIFGCCLHVVDDNGETYTLNWTQFEIVE